MDHIESHRLFELAHISVITAQPEWEHIKDCASCGIAFIQLKQILDPCLVDVAS